MLAFNCSSCTKPIGIGAATIFDGRCQQCYDVESGYGVTDNDPNNYVVEEYLLPAEAAVVTYDDLIDDHHQALLDAQKEC